MAADRSAGDDPFANLNADELWAASAPVREGSAAERDWAAKRAGWVAEDRRDADANRAAARHATRAKRWRRWWPWLAILAVGAAMFAADRTFGFGLPGAFGAPSAQRAGMPPAGVGERSERILPAVTPAEAGRDYVISMTNPDGFPVTFSPCRPWRVVINVRNAPAGGYTAVVGALQEVSAYTGLQLVVEGTTEEQANTDRPAYQPDRYGKRWAPILVDWTTGGAEEGFAGHGGPVAVTLPETNQSHYVSGQVTLDADGQFNQDPAALRAILLHEFGHVVGLAHAAMPGELMAPANDGQTVFGSGDLAGLATVGNGHCTDQL